MFKSNLYYLNDPNITHYLFVRHSLPVVTLYTNLGDSAVEHGLNETEVKATVENIFTKLYGIK